mmetsp:Transcript_66157/g.187703  ORF Transcript_66157/g.187703 Transcript_66157/m.187703 type:complete len:236 (+) Transcript_66157:434-1141(+)
MSVVHLNLLCHRGTELLEINAAVVIFVEVLDNGIQLGIGELQAHRLQQLLELVHHDVAALIPIHELGLVRAPCSAQLLEETKDLPEFLLVLLHERPLRERPPVLSGGGLPSGGTLPCFRLPPLRLPQGLVELLEVDLPAAVRIQPRDERCELVRLEPQAQVLERGAQLFRGRLAVTARVDGPEEVGAPDPLPLEEARDRSQRAVRLVRGRHGARSLGSGGSWLWSRRVVAPAKRT